VVIQRLFATGLQLQTAAKLIARPEAADRVWEAIAARDATIRDIRAAIFELRAPETESLRGAIRTLIDRAGDSLGFRASLRLDGPVDSAVPPELTVTSWQWWARLCPMWYATRRRQAST
jgi:signal transduction histidine kinase